MSDSNSPLTTVTRRRLMEWAAVGALVPLAGATALTAEAAGIIVDGLDVSSLDQKFIDLLRKGGVDCVHKSLDGVDSYAQFYATIRKYSKDLTVATTVREIKQAEKDGKIAFVIGCQDANNLEALMSKTFFAKYDTLVQGLGLFHDLGLRLQGICYNVTNIFGGGCLDHRVPLTRAGMRLVEEIHKLNIVLDVGGHTGEQTSLDAIALSGGVPVVCTHTNMAALNPNARAISDRLAVAIAGTGGVIGLTAISDFHMRSAKTASLHGRRSPRATLDTHLDHYDYLKSLVGIDHIGLGPDFIFGYTLDHNTKDALTFPDDVIGSGVLLTVDGFENISMLGNLITGLKKRGWGQDELDKLLGENWLRVYERVWGA